MTMDIKGKLLSGVLCFLTGCNVSLSYQEQVENIMAPPVVCTRESLDTPYFQKDNWPKRCWWEQFECCDLNELIEIALESNPSIDALYARLRAAEAETVVARSTLFPFVNFDASEVWRYQSENGLIRTLNPLFPVNSSLMDFALTFNYEFDFWHKYRNIYYASLGKAQAVQAEVAQVELITTISVAQAYFALKTNLMREALYRSLYQVRKDYFALQKRMMSSSLVSDLPPLLAEERLCEARQWMARIEEEVALSRHLLAMLLGKGPEEPLCIRPEVTCIAPLAIPEDISLGLLARRPDLMAQIWRVEALGHEVGIAKAEFLPNINVAGLAGFESISWSTLFTWVNRTIGATPALSLPLYTSGAIRANVRAKKAFFDEAVAMYNQLIISSLQEVADVLAMGKAVYDQKQAQEYRSNQAHERCALVSLRHDKGLDDAFALYQYTEEWLRQEIENVSLLYGQYLVTLKLIKALGGGYEAYVPLQGECAP